MFAITDLNVIFKAVGLESLEESTDDSVFFYAIQDIYTAVLDDGATSTDEGSDDEAEYAESDSGCSGSWCAISTFERCKTASEALSRSVHSWIHCAIEQTCAPARILLRAFARTLALTLRLHQRTQCTSG